MKWWPTLNCPFCNGILPNTEVRRGKPLLCPSCSAQLQASNRQLDLVNVIALVVATLLSYSLGIRGYWLVLAVVLLWFPVLVGCSFVFYRLVRPRFERYED